MGDSTRVAAVASDRLRGSGVELRALRGHRRHHGARHGQLVGTSHGHAHALVLDLDLADAALLHDLDELADSLSAFGILVLGDEHGVARVPLPDHAEQLLRVRAEGRDEHELLLARGEAFGLLPDVLRGRGIVGEGRCGCEQLDRALDRRVDGLGRHAVAALDERTELVDHGAVAPRLQHVQERLGRKDLADRRCKRRPARFRADAPHLLQDVQETVGGGVCPQMHLERRDEPGRAGRTRRRGPRFGARPVRRARHRCTRR